MLNSRSIASLDTSFKASIMIESSMIESRFQTSVDYFILSGEIENRKARDSSMVASNSFPYACLYGGQAIPCTSSKMD